MKGLFWNWHCSVCPIQLTQCRKKWQSWDSRRTCSTCWTYIRCSSLFQDERASNFNGLPSWVFYMTLWHFNTHMKMHSRDFLLWSRNKCMEVNLPERLIQTQITYIFECYTTTDIRCALHLYIYLNNIDIVSTTWKGAPEPEHTLPVELTERTRNPRGTALHWFRDLRVLHLRWWKLCTKNYFLSSD